MKPNYKHLTLDDRIEIEKHRENNLTVRQIARELGRAPSTISRELRRGAWRPSNENAAWQALPRGHQTQAQQTP